MYYSRKKEIINSCVEIFILAFVLIVNLRSIIKKRINKYNKSSIDSDTIIVLGNGPSISKSITKLEIAESIDMMRVLEHGQKVRMVPTLYNTFAVDTAEDLKRVEELMRVIVDKQ